MKKILTQLRDIAKSSDFFDSNERKELDGAITQFYLVNDNWVMELSVKINDQAEPGDLEELDQIKFQLFAEMEVILGRSFSECTNSDACSFAFNFDTYHASNEEATLTVIITDYLS